MGNLRLSGLSACTLWRQSEVQGEKHKSDLWMNYWGSTWFIAVTEFIRLPPAQKIEVLAGPVEFCLRWEVEGMDGAKKKQKKDWWCFYTRVVRYVEPKWRTSASCTSQLYKQLAEMGTTWVFKTKKIPRKTSNKQKWKNEFSVSARLLPHSYPTS